MERLRRVASFWNWLPAFRAVAETEHLPTAAEALFVSPSALSRAIRLLEKDVGQPLFRRTGRRIELNDAGKCFLDAVRDGMRMVHAGLEHLRSAGLDGRALVASAGLVTTAYVVPALTALRRSHPKLIPMIVSFAPSELGRHLMQGELDVAFLSDKLDPQGLADVHLGTEPTGIYCGPDHPLYRRQRPSLEAVLEHEFVAPVPDPQGQTHEGWPSEVTRRIGMHVDQMRVGLDVCASGDFLAVLPDAVARSRGDGAALRRLPLDLVPPVQLFAYHRPTLGPDGRAEAIVAAVQSQILRV